MDLEFAPPNTDPALLHLKLSPLWLEILLGYEQGTRQGGGGWNEGQSHTAVR